MVRNIFSYSKGAQHTSYPQAGSPFWLTYLPVVVFIGACVYLLVYNWTFGCETPSSSAWILPCAQVLENNDIFSHKQKNANERNTILHPFSVVRRTNPSYYIRKMPPLASLCSHFILFFVQINRELLNARLLISWSCALGLYTKYTWSKCRIIYTSAFGVNIIIGDNDVMYVCV